MKANMRTYNILCYTLLTVIIKEKKGRNKEKKNEKRNKEKCSKKQSTTTGRPKTTSKGSKNESDREIEMGGI